MIERALLIAVVCIGVIVGAGMVGRGVRHALCDVAGALSPTPIICDGGAR